MKGWVESFILVFETDNILNHLNCYFFYYYHENLKISVAKYFVIEFFPLYPIVCVFSYQTVPSTNLRNIMDWNSSFFPSRSSSLVSFNM